MPETVSVTTDASARYTVSESLSFRAVVFKLDHGPLFPQVQLAVGTSALVTVKFTTSTKYPNSSAFWCNY